jgi:hypothetical protein
LCVPVNHCGSSSGHYSNGSKDWEPWLSGKMVGICVWVRFVGVRWSRVG